MSGKVKLSKAQRRALISARDRGSLTAHLSGRSAWGGFTSTVIVLSRNGWIKRSTGEITEAGRKMLEESKP